MPIALEPIGLPTSVPGLVLRQLSGDDAELYHDVRLLHIRLGTPLLHPFDTTDQ